MSVGIAQLPSHLQSKVAVDDAACCWIWRAARNSDGYGCAWHAGRMVRAHRLTYHLLVDDEFSISGGGLQLDHLCRNRACVNPAHLEPVTNRENGVRGANCLLGAGVSKYVGVTWHRGTGKWRAQAGINGHKTHLGYYASEEGAAKAYDDALDRLGVAGYRNFRHASAATSIEALTFPGPYSRIGNRR